MNKDVFGLFLVILNMVPGYVDMSGCKDKCFQVDLSINLEQDLNRDLESDARHLEDRFLSQTYSGDAEWEVLCFVNGFSVTCFILCIVLLVLSLTGQL